MALEAMQRFGWIAIFTLIATTLVILTCIGWFMFLWWGSIENSFWHMIIVNDWAPRAVSLAGSVLHLAVAAQTGTCISMLAGIAMETYSVPFESLAPISLLRSYAPAPFDALTGLLFPLSWNKTTRRSWHNLFLIAPLTILILVTTTFLLFGSTILLTDVVIQLVPGISNGKTTNVTVDFALYDTTQWYDFEVSPDWEFRHRSPIVRNHAWLSEPPGVFPAFAEYTEPLSVTLPHGVSDTGPVVRAFLPYAASEQRALLRRYQGKAVVFDARVSCQPAELYDMYLKDLRGEDSSNQGNGGDQYPQFRGLYANMTLPKLYDPLMNPPSVVNKYLSILTGYSRGFQVMQLSNNEADGSESNDYSGGFESIFSNLRDTNLTGSVFLLYNNTGIPIPGFPELPGPDEPKKMDLPAPGPEWASYAIRKWVRLPPTPNPDIDFNPPDLVYMSVCHVSTDVAIREVTIHNTKAKPEPVILPKNTTSGTFDFTQAIDQLVGNITHPKFGDLNTHRSTAAGREARGVFHLEKPTEGWSVVPTRPDDSQYSSSEGPWWWCNASMPIEYTTDEYNVTHGTSHCFPRQHYITKSVSLFRDPDDIRNTWMSGKVKLIGNFSIVCDPEWDGINQGTIGFSSKGPQWLKEFFADVYDRTRHDTSGTGGVAAAFQSLLWTLAVTSYAARIPEYDRVEEVESTFYVNVSSPGGPFGSSRLDTAYATLLGDGVKPSKFPLGLSLVVGITILHLFIVAIIAFAFQRLTKLTKLNDPWQAVANVVAASESLHISEYINDAAVRRGAVAKKIEDSEYGDKAVGVRERGGKIVLEMRGGGAVRGNGDEEHQLVAIEAEGEKGAQWGKDQKYDSSANNSSQLS